MSPSNLLQWWTKRLINTWKDECLNKWLFEDYVSKWMNTEFLFHPESGSSFRACLLISKIYISASSHSLTRINRTTKPLGGYSGSFLDHSGLCEHVITQWPATFHGGSMERVMDSRVPGNLAMFPFRSTKVIGVSEWPQLFCISSPQHHLMDSFTKESPSLLHWQIDQSVHRSHYSQVGIRRLHLWPSCNPCENLWTKLVSYIALQVFISKAGCLASYFENNPEFCQTLKEEKDPSFINLLIQHCY